MTLIELMFALVIFAIVAAATVAGLVLAMNTGRQDRNRVAAANLAARELEIVRNQFTSSASAPTTLASVNYVTNPDPLPGGTAGQPLVVDKVPYTVTRNVQWLPVGSGKSACDGGSAITYPTLAVNVQVTWPRMDGVAPVTSNTILTPPKGVLSSSIGFVAVKILDRNAQPVDDQQVLMTGPSGSATDTTANDGCAVFSINTSGSYTLSVSNPGYVDYYGNASVSQTVAATAGQLVVAKPVTYDQAAALRVTLTTSPGYSLPSSLPQLTLGNTNLQPSGTKTVPSTAATTTVSGLFPFTDGYTVWAGGCQQSDPAAAGGTRTAVTVSPGATQVASAQLAPVAVTVVRGVNPVTGVTVVAVPSSATGCGTAENPLTLGVTDATGTLKTSLPAGSWTLQVNGQTAVGGWPTTSSLLPTSGPTSITVVVA
jgi:type II secretory pathway pseudopilin PulG